MKHMEQKIRLPERIININQKIIRYIPSLLLHLLLFALAYIFLYPFLYMLTTSLKSNSDLNNFMVGWIPRSLHYQNYGMAMKLMDFTKGLTNSLIVTVVSTLAQLISCSMAGYGLARYKVPFRKLIFLIIILALIIPSQTIIIPQYLMFANMGWLNSFKPLIVPAFFGYGFKGALYIFIFRQFYMGLPKELEESARVDGCGFIRTFTRIVFPVARSAYIVVLVLAMVWHWSNYYEPSIFVSNTNLQMLAANLNNILETLNLPADNLEFLYEINDNNTLNNAVLMAGTLLVVTPILVAFGFLQKQFIQGIERTGLTGE